MNQQPNRILNGDAHTKLAEVAPQSIDCVITSPPYFRLRDYGDDNQLGLEDSVDSWVNVLRTVCQDIARVLKPTGSLWLNLGDSYSRHDQSGAPPKSLLLGPERLLLSLAADGWTVRNKIIWAKTNPMPSSVGDRLACTYEYVYLLTRSRHYYFDLDAIRVPLKSTPVGTQKPPKAKPQTAAAAPTWAGPLAGNNSGLLAMKHAGLSGNPLGKNPGDVWTMATANYRGAHFATFPTSLVERPLLATCPERICRNCQLPWQRETARTIGQLAVRGELKRACACRSGHRPGIVLDPFFGAGTVGVVAEQHGRHWLGIEVNSTYIQLAQDRITAARDDRRSTTTKGAA